MGACAFGGGGRGSGNQAGGRAEVESGCEDAGDFETVRIVACFDRIAEGRAHAAKGILGAGDFRCRRKGCLNADAEEFRIHTADVGHTDGDGSSADERGGSGDFSGGRVEAESRG